jgi:hypothetical protein
MLQPKRASFYMFDADVAINLGSPKGSRPLADGFFILACLLGLEAWYRSVANSRTIIRPAVGADDGAPIRRVDPVRAFRNRIIARTSVSNFNPCSTSV